MPQEYATTFGEIRWRRDHDGGGEWDVPRPCPPDDRDWHLVGVATGNDNGHGTLLVFAWELPSP